MSWSCLVDVYQGEQHWSQPQRNADCLRQCTQCKRYQSGELPAYYKVPAIYSGPNNPAYWVIGWLSWEQAKEYVSRLFPYHQ